MISMKKCVHYVFILESHQFFLTFTANPHWEEIKECAMMGNISDQNPKFILDQVCRAFEAKRALVEKDVF